MRPRLRRLLVRGSVALAGAVIAGAAALAALWWAYPFPLDRLDARPTSVVVTDRAGGVLLRATGPDGQWREPVPLDTMSRWLTLAMLAIEDERFWDHPGIDPVAVGRAILQNASAGRTVSGASTISMQVARMCEPRERTLSAKAVQAFRALQLEQARTKTEILAAYLNTAPYGGNIRGVEAAARIYFGKPSSDLTLAESALLAGIPKSPTRLRPDRFPEEARRRRASVLARMRQLGHISMEEELAAAAEPLSIRRQPDPPAAWHAAWMAVAERPGGGRTTLDPVLQHTLERLAHAHLARLAEGSEIAAVILDIDTGGLAALVGSPDHTAPGAGRVNGATAARSPGSALKPFIYAAAMEAGRLAPESLAYDVPIDRAGWTPSNFDRTFAGPLPAAEALRRSLNIPAILIAEGVGVRRCADLLHGAGVALPAAAIDRSGLSLVVGTCEVRLLDLTNAYATLGRGGLHRPVSLFVGQETVTDQAMSRDVSAAIGDMLSSRRRAPRGLENLPPDQVPWFCWKTGTSSGRRDAWAVGHNGRYAIGVWIGDFAGRPDGGYLGAEAAEPLLAELFAAAPIRLDRDPPPPPTIVARNPLPPPAEAGLRARIVSPRDGATFVALGGAASVSLRSSTDTHAQWFLNGRLLVAEGDRLRLPPGGYELRCVTPAGADSVRFAVR